MPEKTKILQIEHDTIKDLCISETVALSDDWKVWLLGFINGVNTMASEIMSEMEDRE